MTRDEYLAKCRAHLGDNDGTCPQLTCVRRRGHDGLHDNIMFDCECGEPVAADGEQCPRCQGAGNPGRGVTR